MARSLRTTAAVMLGMIAMPSVSDAGQAPAVSPKITIGAGVGAGMSALHDDASGLTWDATVRVHSNRRFGVELGFGELRTTATSSTGSFVFRQQDGTSVAVQGTELIRRSSSHWLGINALGTYATGRVMLFGGGGVALGVFHRVSSQTSFGCDPPAATICRPFTFDHDSAGARAQGVAGIDVAIGPRLVAFGQVRFGVMGGYVDSSVAAGLRVVLAVRP